jgi:hypothetical protein
MMPRLRRCGHLAVALGLALGLALCLSAASAAAQDAAPVPEQDDVAIYRAVLAPEVDDYVRRRVIQRTTEPVMDLPAEGLSVVRRLAMHAPGLPGLDTSTVRAFLALHREVVDLPDLGDTTLSWVSDDEWRSLVRTAQGWSTFFDRYPESGGVTLLSRIAYSADGSQALTYVARVCPLCGGSDYFLLSCVNGQWRIIARVEDWRS